MPFYIISGLIGLAVIVVSCELFTNSIIWAGIRFRLNHGIPGKILKAASAALPGATIPVIAVIFIPGERGQEISTGAIMGTPFLLSTLAFGIIGAAALFYRSADNEPADYKTGGRQIINSLVFFIVMLVAAVIFSFFPITVKKALAFLFLAAYIFYIYVINKRARVYGEEEPRGLYFSKKKFPEGKLVLLQAAVSVFGMAAGAKFFVSGISHVAPAIQMTAFMLTLLISPAATEMPEIIKSLILVKNQKETMAMETISGSMAFKSSVVVFIGISATDWILSPQAKLCAAAAIASALVTVADLKINRKISAYMLLPGAVLYIMYLVAALKWVK